MEEIHIEKTPALIRAGAYVIIDDTQTKDGRKYAGKILVAYPKYGDGILRSALWNFSNDHPCRDVQNGKCNGCGCDKLAESLNGMLFGHGDREFKITGNGMDEITRQFEEKGYSLLWVV
jgi:hypothetical protein